MELEIQIVVILILKLIVISVDPSPKVTQDNIYIGTSDDFLNNKTKFDIIFIDGNHMMEQVDKDIENSLTFLNEGGLILLHIVIHQQSFTKGKIIALMVNIHLGTVRYGKV